MKANKYAWFSATHRLGFAEITSLLNEHVYDATNGWGFALTESRRDYCEGEFIEKIISVSKSVDPYGKVEELTTVFYTRAKFKLSRLKKDMTVLRLTNPTRTCGTLLKALANVIDGFTITRMTFSVEKIVTLISQSSKVDRIHVARVTCSSIPFTKHATAKIDLQSQSDALKELKSVYKDRLLNIERVKLEARFNRESHIVELTSTGAVTCSRSILPIIEEAILRG